MSQPRTSFRIAVFIAISVSMIGLLAIRLYYLQVHSQDVFQQDALIQRFRSIREEAPRGELYDRNGVKLASYRIAYRINLLYPAYLDQQTGGAPKPNYDLLGRLAEVLETDLQVLIRRTEEKIDRKLYFEPLFVKDDVDLSRVTFLLEQQARYPGVVAVPYPIRQYQLGELAAHVIGYVGQIDPLELERLAAQGYRGGDVIGKMGLEALYDHILRGTPGRKEIEIDRNYRPTGVERQVEERAPGRSLRLTIDTGLQETAEHALRTSLHYISTVRGVREKITNANAGAVVVLDVRTGAVLAMASYPTFDPNLFTDDPARAARILSDTVLAPLWNRAVSGAYQPGSTFKMLTSIAALEEKVVAGPLEAILCLGVYTKVEPKKDWLPQGHGYVNMEAALAHSCDIYFYEMGYRLGPQRLAAWADLFGFGRITGIDLPGEEEGWIPDAARRRRMADAGQPWTDGKSLSAGIGQILTATPLQLARYTALVANGGVRIRPHLVSGVLDSAGNVVADLTPEPEGRLAVNPAHLKAVQDAMLAVTQWGTSTGSFVGWPFRVGAKTGTAEVFGQDDYGVYVAYAPFDKPEIAVAVIGERAGKGEWMNPVAKAVIASYFKVTPPKNDSLYQYGIIQPPPGMLTEPMRESPTPPQAPAAPGQGAAAPPGTQPPPEAGQEAGEGDETETAPGHGHDGGDDHGAGEGGEWGGGGSGDDGGESGGGEEEEPPGTGEQ